MIDLKINAKFRFPLSNFENIADKNIRRLSLLGIYFVIIDIEKCMENGIFKEEKDKITITTGLDFHGIWAFERKELEDLLNVYKGRT